MRRKLNFVYLLLFAFTLAATAQTTKPTVAYSTFLNGTGHTYMQASTIDSAGNLYITGYTSVPDYPVTPGAYRRTGESSGVSMFITKLSPDGSKLIFSTYIGAGVPGGIAVDPSGNVYVTGRALDDFPTTKNAWQPACNNCGFLLKLASNGSSLVFSTGLTDCGLPVGVALDSQLHPHVLSIAVAGCYTTPGAYKTVFAPSYDGGQNALVMKMKTDGSGVLYSTYVGGNADPDDWPSGIVIDNSNHAVITGTSRSVDFPTTAGAYSRTQHGGEGLGDGYVAKLNWDGSQLLASTLIGGKYDERPQSVAVDPSDNIYITGTTESKDFPVSPNAVDHTPDTGDCDSTPDHTCLDGFAVKFPTDLSKIVYSTLLGGFNGDESGMRIGVDRVGHAYVAGNSGSDKVPLVKATSTCCTMFLSVLNVAGTAYEFSTRYGQGNILTPTDVSVDEAGNAYVGGLATYVTPTPNAYQRDPGQNSTGFLGFAAKWAIPPCTLSSTNRTVTICTPVNDSTGSKKLLVSAGATDSKTVTQMEVYLDGTAQFTIKASYFNDYVNISSSGTHQIKVTATDSSGTFSKTVTVKVD